MDSAQVARKRIYVVKVLACVVLQALAAQLSLHPIAVKGMPEKMKRFEGGHKRILHGVPLVILKDLEHSRAED